MAEVKRRLYEEVDDRYGDVAGLFKLEFGDCSTVVAQSDGDQSGAGST